MFSRRISLRTQSAKSGWRRLVVYALIAFVAYAPLAKAACEIEHLALSAIAAAPAQTGAVPDTPASEPSSDEQDQCCADEAAAVMTQTRAASVDGALLLTADFHLPTGVVVVVIPQHAPARLAFVNHRPPPPEPVFRRVPKLLF